MAHGFIMQEPGHGYYYGGSTYSGEGQGWSAPVWVDSGVSAIPAANLNGSQISRFGTKVSQIGELGDTIEMCITLGVEETQTRLMTGVIYATYYHCVGIGGEEPSVTPSGTVSADWDFTNGGPEPENGICLTLNLEPTAWSECSFVVFVLQLSTGFPAYMYCTYSMSTKFNPQMRIFKFIIALFKYLILGDKVTADKYNDRISICNQCTDKCGSKCCICGCYLNKKAKWSTESCPKNKW